VFESIFSFLFKYRPLIFEQGHLTFGTSVSTRVLLIGALVLVGLTVWTYARVGAKARPLDRAVLAALRIAALAVLVFCLVRPMLVLSTVVPQQNYLGILLDDSRSMRIIDGDLPRSAFVQESFGPDSRLLAELADKFQLRFFRFSSSTDRLTDVTGLVHGGARTQIAPALDRAREELAPVPLSGLVLVTDGADNSNSALTESLLALKAASIPVYTVGVGREKFDKDIELSRVSTPRVVLKDASLVVDLLVASTGYVGQKVQLVVEDGGRIVASQEVTLPADGEPAPVRVHFTASESGPRHFRFRIPAQPGELVLENNDQEALIDVRDDREKILYFEGEPRFEVAFTRRAVAEDKNLQVVMLQRTAENKFLRLSVDSANQLLGGFPRSREELFRYKGLVLGSIEASYFTLEQLRMIADFVGDRGGGLLVLGGRKAFLEGNYAGTPLADVLPVELDASNGVDTTFFAQVEVSQTRAGVAHPVTQIAENEAASSEKWKSLPKLSTFNRLGDLKPGATELLSGKGPRIDGGQPVLAFQRFGRGHSMAFAVQDSWIWQMEMPLEDRTHETFWRQMLRWLVNGVPDQLTVALPSDRVSPDEPVRLTAEVDDDSYLKVNHSEVKATITTPSGATSQVSMDWTVDKDGEYRGSFTPTELGMYRIDVDAASGPDTVRSQPTYLDVAESTAEYFGSQMRASLLKRVADETGGRFYTPATVASLPEDISFTGRGSTVQEEKELWDMPIVLITLLMLVGLEWAWRRRRGLA
jgi:uncharacterized membrane protein